VYYRMNTNWGVKCGPLGRSWFFLVKPPFRDVYLRRKKKRYFMLIFSSPRGKDAARFAEGLGLVIYSTAGVRLLPLIFCGDLTIFILCFLVKKETIAYLLFVLF